MGRALARELIEEVGIRIAPPEGPPWKVLGDGTFEMSLYLVDEWEGAVSNADPDEHDEVRWFGPEEIDDLELAHPRYRPLLAEAQGLGSSAR